MTPTTHSPAALAGLLVCAVLVTAGCGAAGSGGGGGEPAPPEPERFAYGPFDVTYQIVSHTHQDQELGGQVNTTDYAMHWYLSVVNAPPALTLTVDSVPKVTGTNPGLATGDLERSAGAAFTGSLSPSGHVTGFTGGEDSNAFLQQLAQSLDRFLPRVPEDGAVAGQAWTDTLKSTTNAGGLEITIELVTQSQAGSWVMHDGVRALEVSALTTYSLLGGGTQMGAEIDLMGTGTRHGVIYLGDEGRFLGGISADTSDMTATVAAMGAMIPIFQTRHDTVSVSR